MIQESITLSTAINQKPAKVYKFVANLANLPKWAPAFCKGIKKVKGDWIVQTMQGPIKVRIVKKNAYGVLDHRVIPSPGVEIDVPMRVVANDGGSEVLFTLFRRPDMTDAQYKEDQGLVRQDLKTLKKVMES